MKNFLTKKLSKNKFWITVIVLSVILSLNIGIYGIEEIEDIKFNGTVITDKLNIRNGPSIDYPIIGSLNYGSSVKVIGKIYDWYIIQTTENSFGVCKCEYILNSDEYKINNSVLKLVNEQRLNNGLKELKVDTNLNDLAKKKAQDMLDNNYFEHTSPIYGSPFDMIKNSGLTYKTAGENIAGFKNAEGAVSAWMNSESHKNNILSNGYNYTGIGIAKSEKYGYIIVQLFIGN